jgi:DNA-binding NtrC family response regulator
MSASEAQVLSPSKTVSSDIWIFPQVAGRKARLLSISDNHDDHIQLNRIIDHKLWELLTANTCRTGIRRLHKEVEVVFCESSLPDGNWKDILNRIAFREERRPQLVVTSRLADAYLWSEVLNLGGFDVLAKPLSDSEVRQVLAAAARHQMQPGRRVHTAGMI